MRRLAMACLAAGVLAAQAVPPPVPAPAPQVRPRVLVLTDIEADPDDTQSLVRLMLYTNDLDIQGIVATTSVHMRAAVHPESVRAVIERYARVRPNLLKHDPAYPPAQQLLAKVSQGLPVYGMAGVGDGHDSPGSGLLLRAIEADDPRPLWITVWGGANTLAQALYRLQHTTTPERLARLVGKLRVVTISDQDDSGAWIRKTFPSLFYIVSPGSYGNATWMGMFDAIDGIDNTTVSNRWLAEHIQQDHGPLGAAYPDVAYGMEGDTPSFLGLIPNGLNVPEHPDWGGWGGRYVARIPAIEETDPRGFNGGVPVEQETRPIWTNAADTYTPYVAADYGRAIKPAGRSFNGNRVTIWRWRDDFQNDFAARMAWTTQPYALANHAPVPALAHADRLTVHGGDWFTLDASGSLDPDGDSLSYHWFEYREAGTLAQPLELGTENLKHTGARAPLVDRPATAHVILRVTDKGSPPLSRYKRVIVTVLPTD